MRRTFLLQLMAGGTAFALSAAETNAISGDWHLLALKDDEVHLPRHRMDLRFRSTSVALHGAVIDRNNGSEIPLATSEFDGSTLRFQMQAPDGQSQAEMPSMTMTRNGHRFEGAWTNPNGGTIGPVFKLVRAAAQAAR